VHQALIYPVTNCAFDTPSQQQNYDAKPLNTPMLSWFYEKYLVSPADSANPMFSILRTPDLSGLPRATVITADIDPLRSEGEAYAQRLQHAGVAVDYRNYEGVTHGFFGMGAVVDVAQQAVAQVAAGLDRAFNYDARSLH
jgi:acetyl esterase/lipase